MSLVDCNNDPIRFTKNTAIGLSINLGSSLVVALGNYGSGDTALEALYAGGTVSMMLGFFICLFGLPTVIGGWLGSGAKPIPICQGFALPFFVTVAGGAIFYAGQLAYGALLGIIHIF